MRLRIADGPSFVISRYPVKPVHRAQQCGLAAAIRPDDHADPLALQSQRHRAKNMLATPLDRDLSQCQRQDVVFVYHLLPCSVRDRT